MNENVENENIENENKKAIYLREHEIKHYLNLDEIVNNTSKNDISADDSLKHDISEYIYKKKYTFNNLEYEVLRYNKDKLKLLEESDNEKFNKFSKFRSVIIRNNKVISFSPEKSMNFNKFKDKYTNTKECWLEDFVDGTMINVFYDVVNNVWEIATRSTIGGNILFFNDINNYKNILNNDQYQSYSNVTFRTMFFDACNSNNLDLNTLDRRFTYSFVLQHPFNRIVTPIANPVIYLINVYSINNNNFPNVEISEINMYDFINMPPYIFLNSKVKLASKYIIIESSSLEQIKETYDKGTTNYACVGCVIYNKDGKRTKIRNPEYEKVRKLRGNNSKLQYTYLCLKQENKIKEFLKYYPEHLILFKKFKLTLFEYTNNLFFKYLDCFIYKNKQLKEYEFEYKQHMYFLHEKYKSELKPSYKKIDKKYVIDYINKLHPAQQMFVINFKHNYKHILQDNPNDIIIEQDDIIRDDMDTLNI